MRSKLRRLAVLATAVLGFSTLTPAPAALAIDNVPCVDPNFVHLYLPDGSAICFASAGTFRWNDSTGYPIVTRITTGNNDGNFLAFDSGALYGVNRYSSYDYSTNPKVLKQFQIY